MSEKIINRAAGTSSAHSERSDENGQIIEETIITGQTDETETENAGKKSNKLVWLVTLAAVAVIALAGLFLIFGKGWGKTQVNVEAAAPENEKIAQVKSPAEIKLEPETLSSAKLEYEGVTLRPAVALLNTTGTIENDPQQTQSVTPLVGGRVEQMTARVGDSVRRGDLLAVVSSPQIAQIHGKMHEAETALAIAQRNLARVQKSENLVAVLQAKARLDEAEATLKRTTRLIELGAGAGKDLVTAETNYKTAKADYDFQTNISLNKEIQEARAAEETARIDLSHIRDEMRSLGLRLAPHDADNHKRDTSLISVYAPAAGMVTERPVNPGAGIEAGTTLFVLSNFSSVYAIANVPEAQMSVLRIGTTAEVRSAILGTGAIPARITYITPNLNEDTRTGRVRLEVPNPNARLRAGMFVTVGFQTGTNAATGDELVVPVSAIQRIGMKTVVFLPKGGEAGAFELREVETGGDTAGYSRILSGLKMGETVVTKGSFILKTQLEKGAMGEEE